MALQLISPTTQLDAVGSFKAGVSIADAIAARQQEQQKLNLAQEELAFRQAQDQRKIQQEQALQQLSVEAFNNPEAFKQVYAHDPKLGAAIGEQRDKYNRVTSSIIGDVLNTDVENRQKAWDRSKSLLQQRGIDISDLPEKYSPEVDNMLRFKQKELKTWDDTFKTIETSQGIGLFNEKTGEISSTGYKPYVKPDSTLSGGATGALIRQLKAEDPNMTTAQALYTLQTGLRSGTQIDENGNIVAIKGKTDVEKDVKAAQAEGTALGKETGEKRALLRSMDAKLPELYGTVDKLNKLADTATYTTTGRAANLARKELGLPASKGAVDRAEYIGVVDNQILPLLRDTFGAQFTEREGQTLRATLGDPNKTPAERKAILKAFINQKEQSIKSLNREVGKTEKTSSGKIEFLGFE